MSAGIVILILVIMMIANFSTGFCVLGIICLLDGSIGAGLICLFIAYLTQRGRR